VNRKQISIQAVLAETQSLSTDGETFTLRYVRSTGKRKGSIKTVAKARRGVRTGFSGSSTTDAERSRSRHTDSGTLPIIDTEAPPDDQYLTPLISHIIGFNHYKVIH